MAPTAASANAEQAKAWDGAEGDDWTEWEDHYNVAVQGYDGALMRAASIQPADQVLDIGCGTGLSTRLAARDATDGFVIGADLSARMVERARQRAQQEGLANIEHLHADAQVHPFEARRFDVAISRFGAMFFDDPVAAFSNVGRAIRTSGRVALLAWQPLAANGWVQTLRKAMAMGRDLPEPPVGLPGPFGLAAPDRVCALLDRSGFDQVDILGLARPVHLGDDPEAAFAYVRSMGLCRGLLAGLDEAAASRALDNLRGALERAYSGDTVALPSAAWLITASKR